MDPTPLPTLLLQALAAQALVLCGLTLATTLARRLCQGDTIALRLCAMVLSGLWLSTLFFHLLLWTGVFELLPALAVCLPLTAALLLSGERRCILAQWRRAARWLCRSGRAASRGSGRWVVPLLALFLALKCLRALLLPPLGWDTLTYHAVKSGLWVQQGNPWLFRAPGGWSSYRSYFGGGEALLAWAMLPFHGDLLAPFVDAVEYLGLLLILYTLGRRLGLHSVTSWMATFYLAALPALHLSIGNGYVEPVLDLTLLGGLLFALEFVRRRRLEHLWLALAAAGLASGIKITALPVAGALVMVLVGHSLRRTPEERIPRVAVTWGAGLLAAAAVTLPWIILNISESGYPLSPVPVAFGPLVLGTSNPFVRWYSRLLTVAPYHWAAEWNSLTWNFRSPLVAGVHLSWLSLVPLGLALARIFRMGPSKLRSHLLPAAFLLSLLGVFYSPAFSVVRIMFAEYSARFLFPALALLVLFGMGHPFGRSRVWSLYLLGATFVHIGAGVFYGWAALEKTIVPVGLVLLLLAAMVLGTLLRARSRWGTLAAASFPLLLLLVLAQVKAATRYALASSSNVLHYTVKYWAGAARLVDSPAHRYHIAMTSGARQEGDSWAMYFFLGSHLQNRIGYVPLSRDGTLLPFGPDRRRERGASFPAWHRRLLERGITHVMSFHPASIEMQWMDSRPRLFARLAGQAGIWGLYRVRGAP